MKIHWAKSFALIILSGALISCCAPMQCQPAKQGFIAYNPLILALDKYNSETNKYPEKLEELIPDYLSTLPKSPTPPRPSNVEYIKLDTGYQLIFHYGGPGMNICKYSSDSKAWSCSGFY